MRRGCKNSCDSTEAAAGESKFCAGGENQVHDILTLRPERKPYGHLLSAQRGRAGNHALDFKQREQYGGGKAGDNNSVEAARSLTLRNDLVHRLDTTNPIPRPVR
jgi:hypothetical protein